MITAEDVVIPSTYDDPPVELAARIYHPSPDSPTSRSLAVIAHPYGFLGGTQHDHVVVATARRLARLGITALTYDSRGCGASSGRASWRGEAERRDYERMIEWLVERHGASATTIFTCVSSPPRRELDMRLTGLTGLLLRLDHGCRSFPSAGVAPRHPAHLPTPVLYRRHDTIFHLASVACTASG